MIEIRWVYWKWWERGWGVLEKERTDWSEKIPEYLQDHALWDGIGEHSQDHSEDL